VSTTEALLLSKIVEDGGSFAMRKVYAQGISAQSFALYEDEFRWMESRLKRQRPLTRRALLEQFPDFEFMVAKDETVEDLAQELKRECALAETNEIVNALARADKENVIDLLLASRERITAVTRAHAPQSDVDLDDWRHVVEQMRQGQLLARNGQTPGIKSGIPHIDVHMGGFMPGQFIDLEGRTGSGKSMKMMLLAWGARKQNCQVGLFCPELNEHEVRCRYHTIASADKDVQKEVGISHSFRNMALMQRLPAFNIKSYQRFCEYIDSLPGRMKLLCGAGRAEKMSVGYIEDRIVELGLDIVFVDPIYLLAPVRVSRDTNKWEEMAYTAEALHDLGAKYDIPIVFANQAHLDGNKGDAPGLEKSFGAKAVVHMSDWVLGVHHMSEENILVVRTNKSRFGQSFRYQARFVPNTGFFEVETPLSANYLNGRDDAREEEVVKQATSKRKKVLQ
jgi:predicted ATP-dependent serine protease